MSKCISSHGEYSEHEPGDPCPWCGEYDTERIIAERDEALARIKAVRAVHQPSDPDDPSACPFSCTCGWWAYDECPTVRALDGT